MISSWYVLLRAAKKLSLLILPCCASGDVLELSDSQLALIAAQYRPVSSVENALRLDFNNDTVIAPITRKNLNSRDFLAIKNGVTLDINFQMQIEEIRWVDQDGYGANGTQGAVTVRGLSIGHLDNGVLKPASIKGVTIDAAGNKGLVMGVGQIGDEFGNGLDVNIDLIQFK